MIFEYKSIRCSEDEGVIVELLNQVGISGWELVTIQYQTIITDDGVKRDAILYLKRRIDG